MRIEHVHTDSPLHSKLQDFVKKHHLLFNSTGWINNYPEQHTIPCVLLNNNNEIIGCFIYYTFKKSLFNFVITPPYTPNIDLFFINPAESVVGINTFVKEVLECLAAYFISLRADYVSINLPDNFIDSQPFIWKGFTSRNRYSYLIDLSQSEETLWNNLSTEKRKSINRAVKDALVIKESTDYKQVHDLIVQSLERNEVAKNMHILHNMLFSFSSPSNSFAFIAYQDEKPIGASYCVISNNRAVYLFGGFDAANKHHGAGVSCMWQSILKARRLNLTYFDFEGSMNMAIERYFRDFGGELRSYMCIEKVKPLLGTLMNLTGRKPI